MFLVRDYDGEYSFGLDGGEQYFEGKPPSQNEAQLQSSEPSQWDDREAGTEQEMMKQYLVKTFGKIASSA